MGKNRTTFQSLVFLMNKFPIQIIRRPDVIFNNQVELTHLVQQKNKKQQLNQPFSQFKKIMYSTKSHYQILKIPQQSSIKQIKMAFKRQIRKHHPDKNVSQDMFMNKTQIGSGSVNKQKKEISMQIIQAYQCLMDAQKRRAYDHELKLETLKYQLKQTRHKDTVSLSNHIKTTIDNCSDQQQSKKQHQNAKQQKQRLFFCPQQLRPQNKQLAQQQNTSQQEDNTILVCQQCFGQNQLNSQHLEQLHQVQLSINCQHCGLYITILQ